MIDMAARRYNEQLRAGSTLLLNLNAVSIAALTYRLVIDQKLDLWSAIWTVGSAMLTLVGIKMLALLQAED